MDYSRRTFLITVMLFIILSSSFGFASDFIVVAPQQTEQLYAYCVDQYGQIIYGNPCCLSLPQDVYTNSGGHYHNANRPMGSLQPNSGCYYGYSGLQVDFTATQVGQVEIIWACADYCDWCDVYVAHTDLYEFLENSSFNKLIGSNSQHPYNHFGTSTLVWAAQETTRQFQAEFYCVPEYQPVGVNDMALPYGGIFDLEFDWDQPHKWHSRGNSVDFRCKPDMDNSVIYHPVTIARFIELCDSYDLHYGLHEAPGTSREHIHCGVSAGN
ncbi:MAG: hypothetical protein ACE15E_23940 [Acidobacteriota bacterium]